MSYDFIKADIDNKVLTLTMNRPDKLNAFTHLMADEMIDVFQKANHDDEVRAIIVTGEGRAFCAGADLSGGGSGKGGGGTFNYGEYSTSLDVTETKIRDYGGRLTLAIYDCWKPVIAAVNGPAVGIGATMQLPMDIRLASTASKFGFVFTRRGIVPEACSSWFLPRLVGPQQALDWMLSGRVFDAEEAKDGGLVHELLAPEDLLPRAMEKAREIADQCSAVSAVMVRQMIWRMMTADHPMEAHIIDSRGVAATGRGADAKEGVQSFLEKRPANYTAKPSTDMPDFFPWWEERQYR